MTKRCLQILISLYMIFTSTYSFGNNTGSFFAKSYAVVIGIKEYSDKNWMDLENAENDAREMAKYFESEGYIVKQFLTDS